MLGSYGVQLEPRRVSVVQDEFPSGMLARGTYNVRSRVTDFDGSIFAGEHSAIAPSDALDLIYGAEWEWLFKIGKEW